MAPRFFICLYFYYGKVETFLSDYTERGKCFGIALLYAVNIYCSQRLIITAALAYSKAEYS